MSLKTKLNPNNLSSNDWILDSPSSLVILMIMGAGMAFVFFGLLSAALGMAKNWLLMVLFGVFSLLSLKQFITIYKMVRKVSINEALGGITAREFVWHKNKDGGVKDGVSGYTSNESSHKSNDERNGKIGKEVRDIYR